MTNIDDVSYDINIEDEKMLERLKDFDINGLEDSEWVESKREIVCQ